MQRQKNGTGTFRTHKRKDGSVYIEYRVYLGIGADGRPWRPSFYGITQKAAVAEYKSWLKNSGNVPIERVSTVGQWADKWLEIYKKNGAKKISYKNYKNYEMYIRLYIKPYFKKLRFGQIRQAHIQQFFGQLPAHFSYSARHYIYLALKGIFKTAIANHLCNEDPFGDFKFEKQPKRKPITYSHDATNKILAFAPKDRDGSIILALLFTGVRDGELCALDWSDLAHIDESYIEIKRTVAEVEPDKNDPPLPNGKHRKKWAIKDIPKSNEERKIYLNPQGKKFFEGLPHTGFFIFPAIRSKSFMTPDQLRHRYDRFLERLNQHLLEQREKYLKEHPRAGARQLAQFEPVRRLSPHKCRHTYATRLLSATGNMKDVQEQLGHKNITTTEIYADVEVDSLKSNVRKLKY